MLHFSEVSAPGARPEEAVFFLHGILGTGANLRGLAQRLVREEPALSALLVDLRGHGRSLGAEPPHTLAACAEDLIALESQLALPVRGVIGHSFGGKVALAYHARRPTLSRVALLDSAPSARLDRAGSEETHAVIAHLERAPVRFESRQQFVEYIHQNGHPRSVADWLAMNLAREPDGFRVRTDLRQIRALLDDYFACELWPVIEHSQARIDLVIAGRSQVYGPEDIARAQALAPRVRTHLIAEAGHWVHVDAAARVAQLLALH